MVLLSNVVVAQNMKRQRTSKLSKLQRAVLGENCPEDIYSAELGELYAKFDGHLLHDELDLCQTHGDFVLAGEIGHTNSDGTGRFNLEPSRVTIGILPLFSKQTPPAMKMIDELLLLIPAFFPTMRGELCAEKLVMNRKKRSIVDAEQGVEFPIRTNKPHRQLDAFAVLDVVEEYVKPHMFHIIAITDLPLFDPEADGGVIFGRANGNRTCVVHCEPGKEKLCINTCVHESLHCMGFDHCSAWRCIMNPCVEEDAVEFTLCPAELRKLMSMQSKVTAKQRFEALLGAFQQLVGYEAEIGWLERMLLQL